MLHSKDCQADKIINNFYCVPWLQKVYNLCGETLSVFLHFRLFITFATVFLLEKTCVVISKCNLFCKQKIKFVDELMKLRISQA